MIRLHPKKIAPGIYELQDSESTSHGRITYNRTTGKYEAYTNNKNVASAHSLIEAQRKLAKTLGMRI